MPALIDQRLVAPSHDVGGLTVRRALPRAKRRHIGPFVFLDLIGPATLPPGQGLDVAPHPHIGLATLTWLFEGEIVHRDSLGYVQPIQPGAVNWMSAGGGIVHSERSPDPARAGAARLWGAQLWIALRADQEDDAPWFRHHPAHTLPVLPHDAARVTLVAGAAHGQRSPVSVPWDMALLELLLPDGAVVQLPQTHPEQAVLVAGGQLLYDGQTHDPGTLLVLGDGDLHLAARGETRLLLVSGEPLPEPRFMDWNFVASSKARLEQARDRWIAGGFDDVPGETERIPYPDRNLPPPKREPQPL